jgi:ATP-binding protein involved in chromosome partitioning
MFQQVKVPVLGIIENMSYFVCDGCGKRHEIFRHGGGRKCAAEIGVPFLGEIPLDPSVAVQGDVGDPIVHSQPDSPIARAYASLAQNVKQALESAAAELQPLPSLELE